LEAVLGFLVNDTPNAPSLKLDAAWQAPLLDALSQSLRSTSRLERSLGLRVLSVMEQGFPGAKLQSAARVLLAKAEGTLRTKKIGTQRSLAEASLGDAQRRKRWREWMAKAPRRALGYVGGWPSAWATKMLTDAWQSFPQNRVWMLKPWTRIVVQERLHFLQRQCSVTQRYKTQICAATRRYRARFLARYRRIPVPLFLRSKVFLARWLRALHVQFPFPRAEQRFVQLTERLLGTPYVFDALGEGPLGRIDKDPTFSVQRLDCVTFLEEAMAMNRHGSLKRAVRATQEIRYFGGKIGYANRKHFPLLQWIPALRQAGWAEPLTRRVGGSSVRMLRKRLTLRSYLARREGREMLRKMGKDRLVFGTHTWPYLPLQAAIRLARKLPSGTIMSVLKPAPANSPFQVAHQGVVIWKHGRPYLRHATKVWMSIVDIPLVWYLRSLTRYRYPRIGIHVLKIRFSG
ncbi:MAG: N-acetylmuramoyl-L-alanine amidase-like domain-containing protein, partial [Myxococcota bacterium]